MAVHGLIKGHVELASAAHRTEMMDRNAFCAAYPAQQPRIPLGHPDEAVAMSAADGLFDLNTMPTAPAIATGLPVNKTADADRHLWVIAGAGEPCSLENCAFGQRHKGLRRGWIKHTNLTGGASAHCGGELWFLTPDEIVINGNSGRYGPKDINQLRNAGLVLKHLGYRVATMGYDDDLQQFAGSVVGPDDLEWL